MGISVERNSDTDDIHSLNTSVFVREAEAGLLNVFRTDCRPVISLVAVDDVNMVTGHIFFSPVSITGHPDLKIMSPVPMAVKPGLQR